MSIESDRIIQFGKLKKELKKNGFFIEADEDFIIGQE